MIDGRFLGTLAVSMAVAAVAGWTWVDRFAGGRAGLLAGLGFTFVSIGAGYHALRWGARADARRFLGAVIGSFTARIFGLLAFAIVVASTTDAHVAVALLTAVAAHFVFGAYEIVYLKRTGALA